MRDGLSNQRNPASSLSKDINNPFSKEPENPFTKDAENPFSKSDPWLREVLGTQNPPSQADGHQRLSESDITMGHGKATQGPSESSQSEWDAIFGASGGGWDKVRRKERPAPRAGGKEDFWGKLDERLPNRSKDAFGPASRSLPSDRTPTQSRETGVTASTVDSIAANAEIEERRRARNKEHARRWEHSADKEAESAHGRDASRAPKKRIGKQTRFNDEEMDDDYAELEEYKAEARRRRKEERRLQRAAEAGWKSKLTPIFLPEYISVADLAKALQLSERQFLRALKDLGFEDITEDTIMTGETAALVAQEYGFDPTVDTGELRDLRPRPPPEDAAALPSRPPIVTIMGHVDHGKTTLLDWLRKSSIAAQEHGGITQHIGAFIVKMSSGSPITFLDTPGHAAFLNMRQRGANCTDIVVLVVAADDSVMPQTLEALKHARAAKVPIIVAINKIDKEEARVDQVKADLARHGVEIEDFGGDVQVVCVSGKTGQGMDELEENIVTLSEILDVRAEADGMAEGWILEASVKAVGKSATVLIKRGTLRPGDCIVAGKTWARVRALRNEAGVDVEEAPPGTPVEILGWRDELPGAGDEVLQAPDEDRAKTAIEYRTEMQEREQTSNDIAEQHRKKVEAEAAAAAAADDAAAFEESADVPSVPGVKHVNFIVKGDVVGSVEAVAAVINEIGNNEVRARILRGSAGQITEFDVDHAAASKGVIVNFNIAVPASIKRLAEDKSVRIVDHSVIYHLHDEVRDILSDQLDDIVSARVVAEVDIAQVFPINVKGRMYRNIAGCKVRNGVVKRGDRVRVMRKGIKVFDGTLP
jgi:translation initiation factor IF-2